MTYAHDWDDEQMEAYQQSIDITAKGVMNALEDMERLAPKVKGKTAQISTTYGALSRLLEDCTHLDAALIKLRDERKITYEDWKPAPQRIILGNDDRKQPPRYFNGRLIRETANL